MSLKCGSKVSGSVSSSASITEPQEIFVHGEMGDKEIVKRPFRAFLNMSIPLNSDMNATPKQMVKNKTDVKPSTPILQKEKERMLPRVIHGSETSFQGVSA